MSKLYALLPVYNEGRSIYDLLERYHQFLEMKDISEHEIVIVDDCSQDDSAQWIHKSQNEFSGLNIHLIKHTQNLGLGGALSSGLGYVCQHLKSDDVIVTMDGDNTHNPFSVAPMMEKLNEGADLVIASRYLEQSRIHGLQGYRIFLSLGAKYLYKIFWRIPGASDYTCGFRAFKGWLVVALHSKYGSSLVEERGFTATAELLKKAAELNPLITEVPMLLRYSDKVNDSSMKVFKTIFRTMEIFVRKFR